MIDGGKVVARGFSSGLYRVVVPDFEFWAWLGTLKPPGGSRLEKAVNYLLNPRQTLQNYMLDGRYELSKCIFVHYKSPCMRGNSSDKPLDCYSQVCLD